MGTQNYRQSLNRSKIMYGSDFVSGGKNNDKDFLWMVGLFIYLLDIDLTKEQKNITVD